MCEMSPAFVLVGSMVWISQPGGGEDSLIVLDRAGAEMLAAAIVDGLNRPDIFTSSFAAAKEKPRSGVRSDPTQRSDPPPAPGCVR